MGLITRVVADDALAAEADAVALQLAGSATSALGRTRNLLLSSYGTSLEEQLEMEARSIAAASRRAEGRGGLYRQQIPTEAGWRFRFEAGHAVNTRPRNTLGWKTPAEALDQLLAEVHTECIATTSPILPRPQQACGARVKKAM